MAVTVWANRAGSSRAVCTRVPQRREGVDFIGTSSKRGLVINRDKRLLESAAWEWYAAFVRLVSNSGMVVD
jgi:hypothetical protein